MFRDEVKEHFSNEKKQNKINMGRFFSHFLANLDPQTSLNTDPIPGSHTKPLL
jgi:hypothetical protein